MAIVNALKFNDRCGAMVTDEESWHLRNRKTFFTVGMHDLWPAAGSKSKTCAVYGCVGSPGFHVDAVQAARRALSAKPPATVREAALAALDAVNSVSRKTADSRLKFLWGFGADDLNRGYSVRDGGKFEIANPGIAAKARDIVEGRNKPPGGEMLPENQAAVVGFDDEHGFQAYCIKESDGVLSFNAGGFESLGMGKYAGGMRLGGFLGKKTLADRKKGMSVREGLRALIDSMVDASENFGMVGGRFHFAMVDGDAKQGTVVRTIHDDRAVAAAECVRAARAKFVGDGEADALVEGLLFGRLAADKAIRDLFAACGDPAGLDLHLRGYKVSPGGLKRRKGR